MDDERSTVCGVSGLLLIIGKERRDILKPVGVEELDGGVFGAGRSPDIDKVV